MFIIKCENNHFYDKNRFDSCPHCKKRKEMQEKDEESKNAVMELLAKKKDVLAEEKDAESQMQSWLKPEEDNSTSISQDNILFDEDATRGFLTIDDEEVFDAVVGWLVCISGAFKGKSYELHTGANNVGRDSTNEISLPLDELMQDKRHFVISYEPSEKKYYALQGVGQAITQVNDTVLSGIKTLKQGDIIKAGGSTFSLVIFQG